MKAEEFFEKQMANIRELWHLSDLQKKMVCILMEEYAALHIADVVGRSELCDHPRSERSYIGHNLLRCNKCGKEFS